MRVGSAFLCVLPARVQKGNPSWVSEIVGTYYVPRAVLSAVRGTQQCGTWSLASAECPLEGGRRRPGYARRDGGLGSLGLRVLLRGHGK